jgi:heptaprenylglyceryl phosphate synthase
MRVAQHWHMTKLDPAHPMNNRKKHNPSKLLTNPVQAVGMLAAIKTPPIKMRDPHLSVSDPKTNRMTTSPLTAMILDNQICCLSKSSVFLISGSKGAAENQMKNAIKKDHQEY